MGVRVFEKCPLCTDDKNELIASMGLNLANLPDQFNGVCPTQIPMQFSHEKACVEKLEIVSYRGAHAHSMAPRGMDDCIGLLT